MIDRDIFGLDRFCINYSRVVLWKKMPLNS